MTSDQRTQQTTPLAPPVATGDGQPGAIRLGRARLLYARQLDGRLHVQVDGVRPIAGFATAEAVQKWATDARVLLDARVVMAAGDELELRGPMLVLDGGPVLAIARKVTGETSLFFLATADVALALNGDEAPRGIPMAREEVGALVDTLAAAVGAPRA